MNKKVIALFCGSFNPPLYSHLSLAEQLLNNDDNIEKIIFVPVSHKYNKSELVEDKHRFNMLKLICDKNVHFEVSDIEFNTSRQPYTFETMQMMQKNYSEYEIRLIIGTDNLKELDTWYEIEKLLSEFKIIVLGRAEDNIGEIIKNHKLLSKYSSSFIITNISLRTNLSSTFVRNEIKNHHSVRYLLPDEVIVYIKNNNLYI
ncbi:MAG: nicotinate (nicotinamide) nucleotide adenylyltransferase [Clostridia bacterium]